MPVLANTSRIGGMANEMSKTGHCEGRNDCRGCCDAAGIGRRVFILPLPALFKKKWNVSGVKSG